MSVIIWNKMIDFLHFKQKFWKVHFPARYLSSWKKIVYAGAIEVNHMKLSSVKRLLQDLLIFLGLKAFISAIKNPYFISKKFLCKERFDFKGQKLQLNPVEIMIHILQSFLNAWDIKIYCLCCSITRPEWTYKIKFLKS